MKSKGFPAPKGGKSGMTTERSSNMPKGGGSVKKGADFKPMSKK